MSLIFELKIGSYEKGRGRGRTWVLQGIETRTVNSRTHINTHTHTHTHTRTHIHTHAHTRTHIQTHTHTRTHTHTHARASLTLLSFNFSNEDNNFLGNSAE